MPDVFMQALELSTLDEQQSESGAGSAEAGSSSENKSSQFFVHTAVRRIFAYQKAHPGIKESRLIPWCKFLTYSIDTSEFAEEVAAWFIIGLFLLFAGVVIFVYSEVKVRKLSGELMSTSPLSFVNEYPRFESF